MDSLIQKIAIGTAQFGMHYGIANNSGKIAISEIEDILSSAKKAGVDTIDTAIAYGESESVLGMIGINDWNVITKLPEISDGCTNITDWVKKSVFNSLERLGISRLHGLLLHHPEQLITPIGNEVYSVLKELKETGYINKIGISIYAPNILEEILHLYQFDIVQAPFNILDQRLSHSGWLDHLADKNIEVHVRSIFLQGVLLMCADRRPAIFNEWEDLWRTWDDWLADSKLNPLQACILHVINNQKIEHAIIGVDSHKHFVEILDSASGGMLDIPSELICNDPRLIEPSNWNVV